MSDIRLSGNDLYRFIQNKDWQPILTLLDEGQIKPNEKIVVQFIAYQHTVYLLPCAVMDGANEVVRKLLEKGANPNQRYEGDFPLSIAVESRNQEATEMLIAAGANLNATTRFIEGDGGQTALMIAAENCDQWAVERLLQAGADPNVLSKKKLSSGWFVTSVEDTKRSDERMRLMKILVSKGCKLLGDELHWPIYRREVDWVRILVELGCPLDEMLLHGDRFGPDKGTTPLTLAVVWTTLDSIKASNSSYFSANRYQIAEMLLRAGANPNKPDLHGNTPLALSILRWDVLPSMKVPENGRPLDMAKLLLKAGADPRFCPPDSTNGSALDVARKASATDFVALFESGG